MTISERLKELLEERKWSTRAFQEEVKRRAGEGTRGVSYASVWEYVEGRTDPPLSFLRVAAEVLDVREAWLTTGDGPRTDDHAVEKHVAGMVGELGELVLAEIRRGFACHDLKKGAWIERDSFPRAALVHAWRRRREGLRRDTEVLEAGSQAASRHETEQVGEAEGLDPIRARTAREIGTALRNTLDALHLDPDLMSQDVREDFVMGMVQAITATAGVPRAAAPRPEGSVQGSSRREVGDEPKEGDDVKG